MQAPGLNDNGRAYAVPPVSVGPCANISENRFPTMSVTFPIMSVTSFHSSGVNSSFNLGFSPHLALTCRPSRSTWTVRISVSSESFDLSDEDRFRGEASPATMCTFLHVMDGIPIDITVTGFCVECQIDRQFVKIRQQADDFFSRLPEGLVSRPSLRLESRNRAILRMKNPRLYWTPDDKRRGQAVDIFIQRPSQ